MTRHDLKIAGIIAAAVVILGLAIGYAVGQLTRPAGVAFERPGTAEIARAPDARSDRETDRGLIPGYGEIYVNDYSNLLGDAAEDRLREDLEQLYRDTGVEMTVLTIPGLDRYGWQGSIEGFATTLFNTWGIGDAGRNDGVLILVSDVDRQMRIELGAGYSKSRDAQMKSVIDRSFLPHFSAGRYEEGILHGVEETIFAVSGAYPGEFDRSTVARGWSWIWRKLSDLGGWLWALAAVPLGVAALALRRYWRNRPRKCDRCGTVMRRAPEDADDAHLDGGQRLEEYLKSVDYDVWHCPSCAHMTITGWKNWFSTHSACPECGYRTLETTSEVLEQATTTSTGRKKLTYDCRNCTYHGTETRTIPRISKSSSLGGGRSSFGGGRSSGGGASGSW